MSKYRIKIDGKTYEMEVELISNGQIISPSNGKNETKKALESDSKKQSSNVKDIVTSPMPGRIVKIMAEDGTYVSKGQVILIIEAMKMENEIVSKSDGILRLFVADGQAVSSNEELFGIE